MDGIFMKTRDKIIISVVVGLVAMSFYSTPMWWGVVFSPIAQQLTTEPITDALTRGFCWQTDGIILRLKGFDLLMAFLGRLQ